MHIITPYDPWTPKKKKTWQEELWEQNQIAEVEAQMLAEVSSKTLPPNSPPIAQAVAGPAVGAPSGGGGAPPVQFFFPRDSTLAFGANATTGPAPFSVQFNNNSSPDALQFDTWTWNMNDGTALHTEKTPLHIFSNTGSFRIGLTGSAPNGALFYTSSIAFISASRPNLPITVGYTPTQTSGTVPITVGFTNTTANYSATANIYKWVLSAPTLAITTSAAVNPSFVFANSGSWTVKLETTGSWDVSGSITLFAVSASGN